MIVEIKKIIYSFSIYFISLFAIKKVNKKQVTFITSFPQIDTTWIERLSDSDVDITILYFTSTLLNKDRLEEKGVKCHKVVDDFNFVFKCAPVLVKSKIIVIDNYLGLLAGLKTSKETEIVQIWHANGAVKKFGLNAKQNLTRSFTSKIRFKRVYQKIDTYVVASENMKDIFVMSYLADKKNYLMYGYYGLDRLLDEEHNKLCVSNVYENYEYLTDKKILLYVPTYRENPNEFKGLNIEELNEKISDEWHIVVKLHPHMASCNCDHLSNVTMLDNKSTIQNFLPVVDCLVTDYSSILFDYSVINKNKKLYIYASDFGKYKNDIGIHNWFEQFYIDHSVKNVDDLCLKLESDTYFSNEVFSNSWNKYNDGMSSERIANYIFEKTNE